MALSRVNNYDGTSTYVGNRAPNAYQYTLNFSAYYERRLIGDATGFARLDYTRYGPIAYGPSNQFGYDQTDYVNLKVGVNYRRWEAAVYARNLTDTRAPEAFEANAGGNGINQRIDNPPFSFGGEVGYRF